MIRTLFFILLIGNLALAAWLMRARPKAHDPLPQVDPGVERLVLLSEQGTVPPQLGARLNLDQESELHCYTLGPFPTQADARSATNRIAAYTVRMDVRSTQTQAEIGNWVYMPTLPDREAALEVARRLEAAGVRDYYIVGAGDEENTISLGLYREAGNAQRRVRRLQALGFEVEARARTEIVPRYWIDYAVQGGALAEWGTLLGENPELEREAVECG